MAACGLYSPLTTFNYLKLHLTTLLLNGLGLPVILSLTMDWQSELASGPRSGACVP